MVNKIISIHNHIMVILINTVMVVVIEDISHSTMMQGHPILASLVMVVGITTLENINTCKYKYIVYAFCIVTCNYFIYSSATYCGHWTFVFVCHQVKTTPSLNWKLYKMGQKYDKVVTSYVNNKEPHNYDLHCYLFRSGLIVQ